MTADFPYTYLCCCVLWCIYLYTYHHHTSLIPDPACQLPFCSLPPRVWKRLGPKPLQYLGGWVDLIRQLTVHSLIKFITTSAMLWLRLMQIKVQVIQRQTFSCCSRDYPLCMSVSEANTRRLYWWFSVVKTLLLLFNCQLDMARLITAILLSAFNYMWKKNGISWSSASAP